MSNDKISFLTSDLAVALGVPRTTVNDWLTRYAAYLEYEMRGKRRVYTLRSLEVLQFVAGLRAQGMSAPEVEKQLEERYGLRPEIATGELEPPVAGAVAEGDTQLVSMVRSTGVMLRRNGEEMDKLFGAMENLSGRYQRTVRNFYLTLFLLLMAGLDRGIAAGQCRAGIGRKRIAGGNPAGGGGRARGPGRGTARMGGRPQTDGGVARSGPERLSDHR